MPAAAPSPGGAKPTSGNVVERLAIQRRAGVNLMSDGWNRGEDWGRAVRQRLALQEWKGSQ